MLNHHDYNVLLCARTTSPWLQCLVMCKDNKIRFLNYRQLVEEHILAMLQKTTKKLVLYYLSICATTYVTFCLWMFHIGFDTFAPIVNFINDA
jgi:hypothetical protein